MVVAGLLTLAGCADGSLGATGPGPRSIPTPPVSISPPTAPATPDSGSGVRQQSCRAIRSVLDTRTRQAGASATEPAGGPRSRTRISLAYNEFAVTLRTTLTATASGDPEMRRALVSWSDASHDIAGYISPTEPRDGNVLELVSGAAREQAARIAVEKLCGKPF